MCYKLGHNVIEWDTSTYFAMGVYQWSATRNILGTLPWYVLLRVGQANCTKQKIRDRDNQSRSAGADPKLGQGGGGGWRVCV